MKHSKLLLGAIGLSSILVGCPGPVATPDAATPGDGGRDGGTGTPDTGTLDANVDANMMPHDGGTDAPSAPDVGVPVTCAGYCTQIAVSCTTTHAQYADTAACMTACTNAGWTMGTQQDTSGNTLGCRVYHALAAVGDATTHCPHAGPLGGGPGGPCSPWRTEPAAEGAPSTTEGAYVRVDRMGMPAVATALVGIGAASPTASRAAKDTYNDSSPNGDATFASAPQMLTAIGAFHMLLDADLVTALHMTPCSVTHNFPIMGLPVAAAPACALQNIDGSSIAAGSPTVAGRVASVIVPDTLQINTAAAAGFPNGRQPTDDVINPTLALILLNLSPCAGDPTGTNCTGRTGTACSGTTGCTLVGTACQAAVGSRAAMCAAIGTGAGCNPTVGCTVASGACVPVPCEAVDPAVVTGGTCSALQTGCVASTCGTGGARCGLHSFDAAGLTPHVGDHTLATFPYFAMHN